MATYTSNYALTKPTMNELADIRTINGNMDTVDEIMHGSQVSIADAYDTTATYEVGDLVMYGYQLYKCITAVSTAEAFDATKWERTTAAAEGSGGGGGTGGIDYSTTEQDTGLKWIDGKPIYQKTVNVGALPNTSASYVAHGILNIDTIVSNMGCAKNGDGTNLPLPNISTNLTYAIQVSVTSTDIVIQTGVDRSAFSGYVTLQYTKTTD